MTNQKKKNKTVLVTGASKGIGKAIAKQFCEDGYNVFMKISIFEMPLDFGASRHGSDMGPSAIKLAGLKKASYLCTRKRERWCHSSVGRAKD